MQKVSTILPVLMFIAKLDFKSGGNNRSTRQAVALCYWDYSEQEQKQNWNSRTCENSRHSDIIVLWNFPDWRGPNMLWFFWKHPKFRKVCIALSKIFQCSAQKQINSTMRQPWRFFTSGHQTQHQQPRQKGFSQLMGVQDTVWPSL